jgi:hypothetical protein
LYHVIETTTTQMSLNLRQRIEAAMAEPPEHLLSQVSAATSGAASAQILTALVALRTLREQLDAWEPGLIEAARADGVSWAELAPALGVASRQAAERRYLRIRRAAPDQAGLTGDERVQAERDRRAADRAVTAWAQRHGADLRQLAGQITALTNLGAAAQPSLDRLYEALGRDDTAALVTLLADTHRHLPDALAERVAAVTHDTAEVRQSTQLQRDQR